MSVVPDGFGEATLNFTFIQGPSNPLACVFGYDQGGGVNPSGHADVIRAAWEASIGSITLWTDNLLLDSVECFENPGAVAGGAISSWIGSEAANGLPPQVAVLIRKSTDLGGREGRGRMYMPGLTISHFLEGGFIHPTSKGILQTEVEDFRSSIAASDLPMVVLHSNPATAPSLVTSLEVQTTLATQRRRLR